MGEVATQGDLGEMAKSMEQGMQKNSKLNLVKLARRTEIIEGKTHKLVRCLWMTEVPHPRKMQRKFGEALEDAEGRIWNNHKLNWV